MFYYAVLVSDKVIDENIFSFSTERARDVAHYIAKDFGYMLQDVNDTYVNNMPLQSPCFIERVQHFRIKLSSIKFGD